MDFFLLGSIPRFQVGSLICNNPGLWQTTMAHTLLFRRKITSTKSSQGQRMTIPLKSSGTTWIALLPAFLSLAKEEND